MDSLEARQYEIKNWFDEIYVKRGFSYLRPVEAYYIFHTILQPKEGAKLLDIACGLGVLLKSMSQKTKLELHGIDISDEAVKNAREFCPEAEIKLGNAEQLPYPDSTFDFVTCIGSLERMINRALVLSEIRRVTTTDAKICIMVRNEQHFTWQYFLKLLDLHNKKGHQDASSLDSWNDLFVENGMKIEAVYPDHWPWYRLLKSIFPWKKIDTSKILSFPLSLTNAYEFIFLLSKH